MGYLRRPCRRAMTTWPICRSRMQTSTCQRLLGMLVHMNLLETTLTLYNLYSHTSNDTHLATARRFNGWVFTAPLSEGHDNLADLPFPHANFHLPEIIGNARAYELT